MTPPFLVAPRPSSVSAQYADALSPFAAFLDDPRVTDLFVNGREGLFVDRGSGAEHVPDWRASEREIRRLASALIEQGGRHIDDATPLVDVRLREGIRVHAVLAPLSRSGTALSIRIPRTADLTLQELVHTGGMTESVAAFLRHAVRRRANFLISGAAGAGKTTVLAALLREAPTTERIVTIEDVAELVIHHPHHIALEARQPNLEGAGGIGLDRLVREALRMKPDRIVVGECRGVEVRELLTALNTGHDGGAGTVHANSLADVATRLEALGALAGLEDVPLARQVLSALEFVVHLERDSHGVRHVSALGAFVLHGDRLAVRPLDLENRATFAPRGVASSRTPSHPAVTSAPGAHSIPSHLLGNGGETNVRPAVAANGASVEPVRVIGGAYDRMVREWDGGSSRVRAA